jgi:hypothetical protein
MRILRPWPAPEKGRAFPEEALFFTLEKEPYLDGGEQTLLVVDCFTEEGWFVADWEGRLWALRERYPKIKIVLHVTALPPALIFPDSWGLMGYLVHGLTWERLHGLPLPAPPSEAPYKPQNGWHLISPSYQPPKTALQTLNTFLKTLQTWRRTLPSYQPEKSSLFYTIADQVYTHFSLSELMAYVASLRR